jgi:hypothetical protein
LFGTLLSILFALSTLFLQNYLEDQLIGDTIRKELGDYVQQLRLDPSVVEPFYTRIQGYITRPGDPNETVSGQVRALPHGVHDVSTAQGSYKVAVHKDDDLWAFLMYDVSDNQLLKQQLMRRDPVFSHVVHSRSLVFTKSHETGHRSGHEAGYPG